MYGLSFSARPDGDGYIITAEGYIPDSDLEGTGAALRPQAGGISYFKVATKVGGAAWGIVS